MQNKKYYPQSGQTSYLAPKKNTQDNEIDPYSTFERKKLRERDQKNDSKLSSEIESGKF